MSTITKLDPTVRDRRRLRASATRAWGNLAVMSDDEHLRMAHAAAHMVMFKLAKDSARTGAQKHQVFLQVNADVAANGGMVFAT